MTTPEPTPAPEPVAAPEAPATPPATDGSDALGDAGKRALDRMKAERDEARRVQAETSARLKAIEDRDLSALQKAQRDAAEAIAERDRTKAETEQLRVSALRDRVALTTGLPASLVGRLQGSTADELTADAQSLLALVHAPRTPQPDPSQGVRAPAKSEDDAAYDAYMAIVNRKH